jgi:hypothetical protein
MANVFHEIPLTYLTPNGSAVTAFLIVGILIIISNALPNRTPPKLVGLWV